MYKNNLDIPLSRAFSLNSVEREPVSVGLNLAIDEFQASHSVLCQ
jgi:hypothetical protein